jgi:UDP-glucuronate 4-epimerase
LITGGAGFIGSHLIERLMANQSSRIVVVDNFDDFYDPALKRSNIEPYLAHRDFEFIEADIRDQAAMNDLVASRKIKCVVHLAAKPGVRPSIEDPLKYEDTNVRGTYVMLEAARRNSVERFIFGSSSSVYGVNSKVPFSEDDPLSSPISPYAATKLSGEAACHVFSHLYGIRVVCLRFFTVYGARQRPDLAIHKFTRLIDSGRPVPLYGDGSSRRDYTYVGDIVDGVAAAIQYDGSAFDVFNLGNSETIELASLVALIESSLGRRAVIDHRPGQPGDVPITFADISKARRLLQYTPRMRIDEGIERFVDWFVQTHSTRRARLVALSS